WFPKIWLSSASPTLNGRLPTKSLTCIPSLLCACAQLLLRAAAPPSTVHPSRSDSRWPGSNPARSLRQTQQHASSDEGKPWEQRGMEERGDLTANAADLPFYYTIH